MASRMAAVVCELVDQDSPLRITLALDRFHLVDKVLVTTGCPAELLHDLKRSHGQVSLIYQQLDEPAIVGPGQGAN